MNDNNHTQFTVSVVMCTYNGEQFLREQMDSILAQDYPLHEIIVQDDRSTDDTWDILQAYAKAHPGMFKLFRNNEQLGFNRNFHTALLRATGQYIAICDQDDIWFPQKIRRQVETIGEADLCFSDYFTDPTYTLPLRNYVAPRTDFEHMLFYDCTPGHTMLLRADLVREIKEWNYHIYYDWWIVMHAQMGRGVVKVCEALNWHRHHAASATTHIFRKGFFEAVPHPTWQPYLLGPLHRLHLQRKRNYRFSTLIWPYTSTNADSPFLHVLRGSCYVGVLLLYGNFAFSAAATSTAYILANPMGSKAAFVDFSIPLSRPTATTFSNSKNSSSAANEKRVSPSMG